MEANRIELRILITSLIAILCVEIAARALYAKDLYNSMIMLGLARILEITLIIIVVLAIGKGLLSIGLAKSKMITGIKKGLIWSAGFGMATIVAVIISYLAGINLLTFFHTHLPKKANEIALFFIVGGIVGPITEELFFRGILYGFLRKWGILIALVISTTVFVSAHPFFPRIPVTQLVGGIVFALAYEIEKNLMVPIVIHVLGNMAIFALSLIS
jgi:membrane protease YdiL (CAAX protease family)